MVQVYLYANMLRPEEELYEYSCPFCCKAIKWNKKRKSPIVCPGCQEDLVDLTALIEKWPTRRGYHIDGENAYEVKILDDIYGYGMVGM